MSFLFKPKKAQINGLGSGSRSLNSADGSTKLNGTRSLNSADGSTKANGSGFGSPRELERSRPVQNGTPASSTSSVPKAAYSPSLEGGSLRGRSDNNSLAPRAASSTASRPSDVSLYPWSQQRLDFISSQANPFPRYGAAANAVASKEGDIYLVGGLVDGSTVKGDLWIVEAGDRALNCYPVSTTSEGPGPRVGHASLLIGNAFVVFGGDTKIDDTDVLDETLYLLNTSTKQWSRSLPAGPRPSGRYGRTLNFLGSKLYIFGGQVEGFFFNDLIAFDLNALQATTNRWDVLVQNTVDGGPVRGQSPPARTNHSVIAWKDRLVLFGGTDGIHWFNDVWDYDPRTNMWTCQDSMGFIPIAREGHAAALVYDVMYVFGGRSEEGKDLGDLAAYRLTTRRWYSFQNMGPSPSPRSGHTMTAVGNQIVVLGGEPSSTPRIDPEELSMAYILDTGKIRYPVDDARGVTGQRHGGSRRPSVERNTSSRDRSSSRDRNDGTSQSSLGSQESLQSTLKPRLGIDTSTNGVRTHRAVPPVNPVPPPQQQAPQSRVTNGQIDSVENEDRQDGHSLEKTLPPGHAGQPKENMSISVVPGQYQQSGPESPQRAGATHNGLPESPVPNSTNSLVGSLRSRRGQSSIDSTNREGMVINDMKSREINKGIHNHNGNENVDSGLGSSPSPGQRSDHVMKELESMKSQNSWYAAELALARKAGYRTMPDGAGANRPLDAFDDDDRPLLDAFFQMKEDLQVLQQSLQLQSAQAAERIAQIERQRDTAVAESVYTKARIAALGGEGANNLEPVDRSGTSERLSAALAKEIELSTLIRTVTAELEAERGARQLAEESAEIALQRATDLDSRRQETSSQLESLRAELHSTHMTARQEAANCTEAVTAHQLVQVERNELQAKFTSMQSQMREHDNIVASLRDAISSSSDKASLLERKLEYERKQRSGLEDKLAHLTAEHESKSAELETTARLLHDAEDLAGSHAAEAKVHREALLGLTQRNEKDDVETSARDERLSILQQRLEAANTLLRKNQNAADTASERLRRAEERIAGLETYQEQISREGLVMRRHLQAASRDALTVKTRNAELERQFASEKLNSTAMQVQHSAIKGLLRDRGLDVSAAGNTTTNVENQEHLQQLEQQVSSSLQAYDEMKSSFEVQQQEANRLYEEKLAALDNDYQAAVKYLKGTEKMLSKMKQELHRYKAQNKELEDEVSKKDTLNPEWTQERDTLRTHIEGLESRINHTQSQLEQQARDAQLAHQERDHYRGQVEQVQSMFRDLQEQNAALETRAAEAERKAQLLLSTVGTTVNNYVRDTPRMSIHGHNRGASTGGDGIGFGQQDVATRNATVMARNSMALDTLASELESLRSHWETTNKTYRNNDRNVNDGPDGTSSTNGEAVMLDSLANWRKKLELEEADEDEIPENNTASGGDEVLQK